MTRWETFTLFLDSAETPGNRRFGKGGESGSPDSASGCARLPILPTRWHSTWNSTRATREVISRRPRASFALALSKWPGQVTPPLFLVSDGDLYQRLEEDMLALWLVPVAETRALYPPLRAGVVCRPS
jgi:hypothetical protein